MEPKPLVHEEDAKQHPGSERRFKLTQVLHKRTDFQHKDVIVLTHPADIALVSTMIESDITESKLRSGHSIPAAPVGFIWIVKTKTEIELCTSRYPYWQKMGLAYPYLLYGPIPLNSNLTQYVDEAHPQVKFCWMCWRTQGSFRRCSRCHKAVYCGEQCQKRHWKQHRIYCLKLLALK